jgi:hypothetical protein
MGRSPPAGDLGGEENWKKKQGPDLSARPLRCNYHAAATPLPPSEEIFRASILQENPYSRQLPLRFPRLREIL